VKLLPIARSVAASTMLAVVLVVSLLGAACEVRCVRPSAAHGCCPMLSGSSHSSASIAQVAACRHSINLLFSDPVAPGALIAGLAALAPLEPVRVQAFFEAGPVPVTTSPPKFNLRI